MISNERFTTLFLNWWMITEKVKALSEMEDLCKNIGMTRGEFIELVSQSNEFISKNGWTPDPNTVVNTESKNVNIGDSDQAILETALTQLGIPYTYKAFDNTGSGKIEIKAFDGGEILDEVLAKAYFTRKGTFTGIL